MLLCMLVSVFILGRAVSRVALMLILFFISSLFYSVPRDGAADFHDYPQPVQRRSGGLNAAFLPSIMLSGFIFQIDSMPAVIRAGDVHYSRTLFRRHPAKPVPRQNIPVVLIVNVLFLIASAVMFIGLTWLKTKRRLD